ncbi:MAG: tetratricopeptide repeat protein [Kiloniellaceae bacterium]
MLAYNNLGAVLLSQGKTDEAITQFEKAMELEPDLAMAHNNLGNALRQKGDWEGAADSFRRCLELSPDIAEVHRSLGSVLQEQGKIEEAAAACRRALDLAPSPGIEVKLATLLPRIPESKEALIRARRRFGAAVDALSKKGLSLDDPYKEVGATNFYLAYHGMNDRDLQQAVARLYLKACPSLAWSAPTPAREGRTRLRLGFISRYFREHAVGWSYRGVIERLDRARFEVVVFTFDDKADTLTREIRTSADRAVTLPKDLARARDAIAAQALDVLVYTDIGMDPLTYFLAFARLAPVQCVMAGHPVTTGIPNLDYFISNELSEPVGAEDHYSETLVRLASSPVYYSRPSPPAQLRTREDFGFGASEHLYACPQTLFKFHPDFDALLAAILRRDGAGRLVLIEDKIPARTKPLACRLADSMPDVIDRVCWLPRLNFDDFLSLLIVADVLLDPLHFSGGNTTRQSLAFNKPVVTLPGDFMRGRISYGQYRRTGLTDCVAKDADDYVDIAVRLGTDPDWRHEVEQRIAAASPVLYENPGGMRELEEFFLTVAAKAGVR